MVTPKEIKFSQKIQEIRGNENANISGFVLFEAFATWLRTYVDPWVIQARTQHSETKTITYKRIEENANQFDEALKQAKSDYEKTLAYSIFIFNMLNDPLDFHPPTLLMSKPLIYFYGSPRAVPGIYNASILNASQTGESFTKRKDKIEGTGNYSELPSLNEAVDCFYTEIKAYKTNMKNAKVENDTPDAIITAWVKSYYDATFEEPKSNAVVNEQPTIASMPPDAPQRWPAPYEEDKQDADTFTKTLIVCYALGVLISFICVVELENNFKELPGGISFPFWVSAIASMVLALSTMYHHAKVRNGAPAITYPRIFFFGPIVYAILGGLVSTIVTFAKDLDSDVILMGSGYGALVGLGLALLMETGDYLLQRAHRRSHTARPHIVSEEGSPSNMNRPLLNVAASQSTN